MKISSLFVVLMLILFSISAEPQPKPLAETPMLNRLVNIKGFGAIGDGRTDDTAAIQSAIDYAYNNHIQAIFCPSGNYVISSTIYLDPPGNLRSNFANPKNSNFSLAFIAKDDGLANNNGFSCALKAKFNNGIALIVGPGQHMIVRGIGVFGPGGTYRANQPRSGVGIGIAGGAGGASDVLIENTYVENFYTLYQTGANGNGSLADSNTFRKIDGHNCHYGLYLRQTQNDSNELISSRLGCTVAIYSPVSRQITVLGGNFSAVSGKNASFNISNISRFSKSADGNGFDYTFTGMIPEPDIYIPNVYNSFTIVTSHFGVIPLTMINWIAGTKTATFKIWPNWAFATLGMQDLSANTDIEGEVVAVKKVYASERVITAMGQGISLEGVHIENPNACQSLIYLTAGFNGSTNSRLASLFYNSDPASTLFSPPNNPTDPQLAQFYCGQTFPFIFQDSSGNNATLSIDGGNFGQATASSLAPVTIEVTPRRTIIARQLRDLAPINMRIADNTGDAYGETGGGIGHDQFENQANGAGEWDADYFMPHGMIDSFHRGTIYLAHGNLTVPYYGYRPAPWASPNLSPDIYALVSGSLGAIGSYPPIDCQTVYKSIGWNSRTLAHIHLRSASCPGYSWGQDLTDRVVGNTVTWSYKGQSGMLYLDASTLSWMFPGLGITIPNSYSAAPYIVTGVYPQLGYITVMAVGSALSGGGPLQGNRSTVYTCSSNCSIGQVAYVWTQY